MAKIKLSELTAATAIADADELLLLQGGVSKRIAHSVARVTDAVHLGVQTVDGSWRITTSGTSLVIERRESGNWVTKQTISA